MDLHAPLYLYDTTYCKGTEDSELFCPPDRTYRCVRRGATLARPAVWARGSPLPAGLPMVILQDPVRELYELLVALVFGILDTFGPRTRSVKPRN